MKPGIMSHSHLYKLVLIVGIFLAEPIRANIKPILYACHYLDLADGIPENARCYNFIANITDVNSANEDFAVQSSELGCGGIETDLTKAQASICEFINQRKRDIDRELHDTDYYWKRTCYENEEGVLSRHCADVLRNGKLQTEDEKYNFEQLCPGWECKEDTGSTSITMPSTESTPNSTNEATNKTDIQLDQDCNCQKLQNTRSSLIAALVVAVLVAVIFIGLFYWQRKKLLKLQTEYAKVNVTAEDPPKRSGGTRAEMTEPGLELEPIVPLCSPDETN